jgi:hypothetical protein
MFRQAFTAGLLFGLLDPLDMFDGVAPGEGEPAGPECSGDGFHDHDDGAGYFSGVDLENDCFDELDVWDW